MVGASIPLPFFDRNRGGIEEARSRLAKVHEERRAAQARVAAALADAYAALASAHDEVTALRSAVLPGSQQTFDAVSEGYRLGRFGYLDVLESQRTLIGAGSQYLRALSDYHKAIANVERLIGAPLAGTHGPADDRERVNYIMQKKTIAIVAIIVVIGLALAAAILRTAPGGNAAAEGAEAPGPLEYPRGPHGARLLSDDGLQVEMTIYETGVPPHFRVYPFDCRAEGRSRHARSTLVVELHRLGGRVDRITFTPEADYLRGNAVVEEPHSFDVKVSAHAQRRRQHAWSYSQIEGKVQLGPDQVKSAGIVINTVGPRQMRTLVELPGEIKADATREAHVVPRLQGVVIQVLKQAGDRVREGEVMAVLNSRELADAKSTYIASSRHVEFARVTLEREENLWKKKISAERDYLQARREARGGGTGRRPRGAEARRARRPRLIPAGACLRRRARACRDTRFGRRSTAPSSNGTSRSARRSRPRNRSSPSRICRPSGSRSRCTRRISGRCARDRRRSSCPRTSAPKPPVASTSSGGWSAKRPAPPRLD